MTINRLLRLGAMSAISIMANRIATAGATIGSRGVESISLVQFNLNLNGFFYEPLQAKFPAIMGR